MAPAPTTLPELVQQLGSTFSPFERLKILSRAWAVLRAMTPQERLVVTSQLGLDHADEVLDAIVKRSGHEASPTLVAMIERAQMKGTTHLPALIADLRDPRKRTERLRQGAQTVVEEALAGAPAAPMPEPKPKPAPPAMVATPVAPVMQAPPVVLAVAPEPVPIAPPPPQVVAPPVAEPPPPPKPPPPAPPARKVEDEGLAGKLAAASSLTARFHVLRRHLEKAKGLPADDLRATVEAFPDGWARRRALVELLRTGSPAALGDALGLVEILGSERDRLWCLGTLASTLAENRRALNSQDRETLLAAAPSPTARRRLERRLG
ncbi:MAG TPA: hypothetical protein VLB76_04330 [Thermoanaerobaculia bacterium]|jgi:hypothetical protein|nr:hypothetical protein [Thermoanaerobaculia bacterium]